MPEFGFVAEPAPSKTTTTPPTRSWNGATYVRSLAAEVIREATWRAVNGGTLHVRSGSRGQLIALSEEPTEAGYLICAWCGAGLALDGKKLTSHSHLLCNIQCTGPMRQRSLAHPYETDLLDLTFDRLPVPIAVETASWRSLLYALLEGSALRLELSRSDIDGTLHRRPGDDIGIVMFDTVPGGVLRIANALDRVLRAALDRVSECDCGEETSCYGCLRSFHNQRHHEKLSRQAALNVLRPLLSGEGLTLASNSWLGTQWATT